MATHPTSLWPSYDAEAAGAYDAVGHGYRLYADGDCRDLFSFSGTHSFADRQIWRQIEDALQALHDAGRHAIRIVDAGCGPGTWLIRTVLRARALGFVAIEARGFDIAQSMIGLARSAGAGITDPRAGVTFDVSDIGDALAVEEDGAADLLLCLNGVLNHLPVARHSTVAAEMARVCSGTLLITARSVGSLPSIYIAEMASARSFRQDNATDRLEIDLADGRHLGFNSHLFSASELSSLFGAFAPVKELIGLDVFHSRFVADHRWNPAPLADHGFEAALARLEQLCANDPAFIDRAAHILLRADCHE